VWADDKLLQKFTEYMAVFVLQYGQMITGCRSMQEKLWRQQRKEKETERMPPPRGQLKMVLK